MRTLFLILALSSSSLFGQIKIDKAGDGWDLKVDSALALIKSTDSSKYDLLDSNCFKISFWLADFSSCDLESEGGVIYVSARDISLNSINNLAAVLVHESLHLQVLKNKTLLSPKEEENICYRYELEFVSKLPNAELWLKKHIIEQIENTQN